MKTLCILSLILFAACATVTAPMPDAIWANDKSTLVIGSNTAQLDGLNGSSTLTDSTYTLTFTNAGTYGIQTLSMVLRIEPDTLRGTRVTVSASGTADAESVTFWRKQ